MEPKFSKAGRAVRRASMSAVLSDVQIDRLFEALEPEMVEWSQAEVQRLFVKNGPYKRDWKAKDRGKYAMHLDNLGRPDLVAVSYLAGDRAIFCGNAAKLLGDDGVFPVSFPDLLWLGRNPTGERLPRWLQSVVDAVMKSQ